MAQVEDGSNGLFTRLSPHLDAAVIQPRYTARVAAGLAIAVKLQQRSAWQQFWGCIRQGGDSLKESLPPELDPCLETFGVFALVKDR